MGLVGPHQSCAETSVAPEAKSRGRGDQGALAGVQNQPKLQTPCCRRPAMLPREQHQPVICALWSKWLLRSVNHCCGRPLSLGTLIDSSVESWVATLCGIRQNSAAATVPGGRHWVTRRSLSIPPSEDWATPSSDERRACYPRPVMPGDVDRHRANVERHHWETSPTGSSLLRWVLQTWG
jgi:hypothetical protein